MTVEIDPTQPSVRLRIFVADGGVPLSVKQSVEQLRCVGACEIARQQSDDMVIIAQPCIPSIHLVDLAEAINRVVLSCLRDTKSSIQLEYTIVR